MNCSRTRISGLQIEGEKSTEVGSWKRAAATSSRTWEKIGSLIGTGSQPHTRRQCPLVLITLLHRPTPSRCRIARTNVRRGTGDGDIWPLGTFKKFGSRCSEGCQVAFPHTRVPMPSLLDAVACLHLPRKGYSRFKTDLPFFCW